ncbi:MAG: LysR family transcriptional regulator ArgP [Proteobacteria bacterium]|nr:LysR family transcriptional regulator ArgP [Desulfobacula sp.]MBU3952768.1 LysR family transcriptional regulator ArgP [Pseudomonadota bacterium]MBU4131436.1 LysR family transcriptional regulator ArgP [Pseudomonadota bacterium]
MLDYKLLQALANVIQEGGFDKAALRLNLTQSAVSQRIKLLEDQMGTLLVTRTVPPAPTPEGKHLLKHYIQVQSLEADLTCSLTPLAQENFQVFAVGINADSLATWFFPAVTLFLGENRVLLDLKVDDQEQTHRLLRNGEVAGCISSEDRPVQGCSVTPIGTMTYRMVAAPQFVKTYFPRGFGKNGLEKAPAVIFNRRDDLHSRFLKTYFKEAITLATNPKKVPAPKIPIHYVPSSEKFVGMILDGLAYGMVPDLQGLAHIKKGLLVDLAPDTPVLVDLYWHRWQLSSILLDEFSKAIVKNAVIC